MASLQEARRERDEAVARMAEEDEAASNRESGIGKGEKSLTDAVTGATKDKAQEASEKARETKDAAAEKAGEMKDRVKDSMVEIKEQANKSKDKSTAKLMDFEEPSQAKGSASEKMGEFKESATEAARKAREFLVEGKEEARVKLAGQTKDHLGATNESARRQSGVVKQRAAEKAGEDRGKLDEGDKKRGEHDGGEKGQDGQMREKEEDDIMLRVKDADQMTGTYFTDPGKMGQEGTGPTGYDCKDKQG